MAFSWARPGKDQPSTGSGRCVFMLVIDGPRWTAKRTETLTGNARHRNLERNYTACHEPRHVLSPGRQIADAGLVWSRDGSASRSSAWLPVVPGSVKPPNQFRRTGELTRTKS